MTLAEQQADTQLDPRVIDSSTRQLLRLLTFQLPDTITIRPETRAALQVQHTLSLIESIPSGDDLRGWTPKAQRALRIGEIVFCTVGEESASNQVFVAQKLSLLVASQALQHIIVEEPEVVEIHLAGPGFAPSAIAVLCYWLNSVCDWSSEATSCLLCPADVCQALELQHNAQPLSIDQYTKTIENHYFCGIWERIPSLEEAFAVSYNTFEANDPVLNAWVSRIVYLQRVLELPPKYLQGLRLILAIEEHRKLLRALDNAVMIF
ncbi:hypothetical protein EK21DRAFT_87235 [Setomelanomma holmii]|uniref:Uncharacterized protein n=1 Tax=Setomelanomma holmii TaxID=210430 RepID=A0A9P4LQ51_9PLEO|nr:hypothetical protein EK21DRAFT_87235 [Setomelanomma holmii]